MGRFGWNTDPAIDFCVEVDVIEGMAYDAKVGLGDRKTVEDRIFKAMQFNVGGVGMAVEAKAALRRIEAELMAGR